MAYANGRIPSSALMGIPGNGRLLRTPALAYTAMHLRAMRDGVSLALIEGAIRRTYREFAAQVAARAMWCAQGRCGNAAVPGTSNHGLGTTVDLMTLAQRQWIDRHGAIYGWAKKWSDAAWEWWHMKYRYGVISGSLLKTGPRVIRKGSRPGKDIKTIQVWLRQAGELPQSWKAHTKYTLTVRRAVRRLQKKNHLKVDGVIGPRTLKALKRAARKGR